MSKSMEDPVLLALKRYGQEPGQMDKRALLLTPQGGYFLYGNRFCSIAEYELEFFSASLQLHGKTVPKPLLFHVRPGNFCVTGESLCVPTLVSLIFHIDLGDDEPLRGILFALGQEAELALFTDVSVEALYRMSRRGHTRAEQSVQPDGVLQQRAEALRRNDLHWLTELYLHGRQLRQLQTAFFSP